MSKKFPQMASYYRFFVALLAAFGCFFAYFCRLNLSLVINEMVESNVIDVQDSSQDELNDLTNNLEPTNEALTSMKFSRFEEQTLAELSSGRPWWIRKEPSKHKMPIIRRNQSVEALRQNTMRMLQGNSIETLRIEQNFDVHQGAKKDEESQATSTQSMTDRYLLDPLPKLKWSKEARNDLLGAFFLGYVIFQIPAARASEIFGAKALILVLGFGTGFTSILFVASTRLFGDDVIWAAYLVRFVMGASQAGLFPSIYVLYCKWLPRNERSTLLPVASAFARLGTIVMNFVAPIVLRQFGWPMVFMLSGGSTLIWSTLFLVFGSSLPTTSRWLPSSELLHIESRMDPCVGSLKQPGAISTASINDMELDISTNCAKPKNSMDWIKVLTNKPIAVLTIVMFSSEWSNMLLLVLLPSFLGSALSMELEQIGTWTIALVTVYCFAYPLAGTAASYLERSTCCKLSSLNIRKLFEALAHLQQASGCLLIALYADTTIILLALFLMMLGRSTVGGGQCLMPPELSKEYPGTVMAYANAIANLACYFGPMIVNLIVDEPTKLESWRLLWFISTGIFLICGLLFVLFADNSPQDLARKPGPSKSISQMQLTLPPYIPPPYNPEHESSNVKRDNNKPGAPKRRAPDPPTQDIQMRMTAFSSNPAGPSSADQRPNRFSGPPSLTRRI